MRILVTNKTNPYKTGGSRDVIYIVFHSRHLKTGFKT